MSEHLTDKQRDEMVMQDSDRVVDCINRCREKGGHSDCDTPQPKDQEIKHWLIRRAFTFVSAIIAMFVAAMLYSYVVQERELEEGLLAPVTKTIGAMVEFVFTPATE